MASRRKKLVTIAWLASWALIFVLASSMPAWLAIALAIATFAGFLLFARARAACMEPGGGAACAVAPPERQDGPSATQSH